MPAEFRRAGLSVRQVLESLLGSDKCIYGKSLPAFISSLQVRSPIKKRLGEERGRRVSDKCAPSLYLPVVKRTSEPFSIEMNWK